RLVLVPRHKERFEDVARLIEARGLPLVRRSGKSREPAQRDEHRTSNIEHRMSNGEHRDSPSSILHPPSSPPPPVCLLDTLGELGACWGLADVAFVGGSLTRRGGQNMIEPAAYGAALLFGPNTWNFRDVVERLLSEDAARVVTNADELTHAVRTLLLDPHAARQQGDRACALVRSQQGAAERTVQLILDVLPDAGGPVVGSEKRAA
ncbi:MAG: hypothetical protein KY476_08150, partial [Planctomycetes bacterium]|nr:hypothetical protein [Planctomycetota bacterium]